MAIDSSFIRHLTDNLDDAELVKSLIAVATSMEVDVLASGVENKDQVDFLLSVGCNKFQGNYFAKPLSYREIPLLVGSLSEDESLYQDGYNNLAG